MTATVGDRRPKETPQIASQFDFQGWCLETTTSKATCIPWRLAPFRVVSRREILAKTSPEPSPIGSNAQRFVGSSVLHSEIEVRTQVCRVRLRWQPQNTWGAHVRMHGTCIMEAPRTVRGSKCFKNA